MTETQRQEFLVRTVIELPEEMSDDARTALLEAEYEAARALRSAGVLVRIWRIPGAAANYGLWSVSDATALHDVLSSLPMSRWMTFEVIALARHPLEMSPNAGQEE